MNVLTGLAILIIACIGVGAGSAFLINHLTKRGLKSWL